MKYYRLENIDVHQKFFDSWENIKAKYNTTEIIKNLLVKKVSLKTIASSFGVDIQEIKKLAE